MGFNLLLQDQNRAVGKKLGIATLCMFTLPIVAFYISLSIFRNKKHPDNWAGGVAILITNMIIAGYCFSAFAEDDERNDKNDELGPKVGVFKQRTD
mmetsp:Transcript_18135/g.20927  ORF Transcript_18135/g.20927 Transcript_18135/m.20927 type:complete len:96 (-) Transcript_18135:233-520(-)